LNVRNNPVGLTRSIRQLAARLLKRGIIENGPAAAVGTAELRIKTAATPVRADHFVQYLYQLKPPLDVSGQGRLHTTLDSGLQHTVQTILDHRLQDLKDRAARHGAVLIVDHQRSEVLAWVNSGTILDDVPASWIDAITTPRQPGSTLMDRRHPGG
jgi:penicillin-binding protein 1C